MVESCELLSHLANIGDVRSLILHPASTTHRQLNDAQLAAAGAGPEVVRLYIGLETVDDIIADLDRALTAAVSPAEEKSAPAGPPPRPSPPATDRGPGATSWAEALEGGAEPEPE